MQENNNWIQFKSKKRGCTDMFCCWLFLAFWGVFIYSSVLSLQKGNFDNLIRIYDEEKKPCGLNEREKYPYLYIQNIKSPLKGNVCVSKCPKSNNEALDCYSTENIKCKDITVYPTNEFLNRICIPDLKYEADELFNKIKIGGFERVYNQIKEYWKILWISFLLTFVIGYFYNWFVKHFTDLLVMTMVLGSLFGIAFIGLKFYTKGEELTITGEINKNEDLVKQAKNYFNIGIFIWIIDIFILCNYFYMFDKIKNSIKIVHLTADFIEDVPRIIFVPFIVTVINLAFFLTWSYLFALLTSIGEINYSSEYIISSLNYTIEIKLLIINSIFCLFWGLSFLSHLNNFVIMYSANEWFNSPEQDDMTSPIFIGFMVSISYHLGTIAFGSLILTVFWVFNIICSIIHGLVIGEINAENINIIQKILARFLYYCIGCFECVFKYLNKFAYIECIIESKGFCSSSAGALKILQNQMSRFTILNVLIKTFNFLASVFISCVITVITYFIIKQFKNKTVHYEEINGLLLVIFLLGLYISLSFTQVYNCGANTIMYCYLKGFKAKFLTQKNLDGLFSQQAQDEYELINN